MDIKQFIENTKDYPDTTPVKIGEAEVPLGSLRSLNAAERKQIEEKLKGVETKENELNTRQQAVLDLAKKAQEAYEAAETAKRAAEVRPATVNPLDDPFFAPIKKALDERDGKYKSVEAEIAKLSATVQEAIKINQLRAWQEEYDRLDFGKRDKKPTRDELLKYAADNKVLDSFGIPSVRGAWDRLSAPDRLEEVRKEAIEKGREEGRMEAMALRVPAPGVSGPGQGPSPLPKAPKSGEDVLGDLYAEALKDPELRSMIEQLPAGIM